MISMRGAVILIVFMAGFLPLHAQVNDAQLWMTAGVEKRITRSLSAEFTQEIQMDENITEVGTIYSEPGLSYRFSPKFRAGVACRFSLKRRMDDHYEQRLSWHAQVTYREKINPVQMIFRLRYQSRYDDAFTSPETSVANQHFRTRVTLKYDTDRKFEPWIYGETYFRTGSGFTQAFDQLRLSAGVEYRISQHHMIDLYYLVSREYNVNNPETDYITGIGYSFTF